MNKEEIVSVLRKESKENKASEAVFHVFAMRKRARNTVVLTSLYNKMKKEGFEYSKQEYIPALKLLSSLGFGTLIVDSKGKIRGLKNVNTTLQSIGRLACGQESNDLVYFKPRNKFMSIVPKAEIKSECRINLEVDINGKTVHIPVPKELNSNDIALLIGKLQSA